MKKEFFVILLFVLGSLSACNKNGEEIEAGLKVPDDVEIYSLPSLEKYRLRINDLKTLEVEVDFDSLANVNFTYSLVDAEYSDKFSLLDLRQQQADQGFGATFDYDVMRTFSNPDPDADLSAVLYSSDTIQTSNIGGPVKEPPFDYLCSCSSYFDEVGNCYLRSYYGNMFYCDGSQCTYCSMNVFFRNRIVQVHHATSVIIYSE